MCSAVEVGPDPVSLTCCQQPQQQKQFAINFCTTSYRTEMEAKHCLEKIFSGAPLQHCYRPVSLARSLPLFVCRCCCSCPPPPALVPECVLVSRCCLLSRRSCVCALPACLSAAQATLAS